MHFQLGNRYFKFIEECFWSLEDAHRVLSGSSNTECHFSRKIFLYTKCSWYESKVWMFQRTDMEHLQRSRTFTRKEQNPVRLLRAEHSSFFQNLQSCKQQRSVEFIPPNFDFYVTDTNIWVYHPQLFSSSQCAIKHFLRTLYFPLNQKFHTGWVCLVLFW